MTMLEKAARAAYDGHGFKPRDDMGGDLGFDQLATFQQENWLNAARAALMAIRTPEGYAMTRDWVDTIDAILNEPPCPDAPGGVAKGHE